MTPIISKTPIINKLPIVMAISALLTACQSLPQLTEQSSQIKVTTDNVRQTHPYEQSVLTNGLTIVTKTDRRSPIAMTQVWYKVGSDDEPIGKGGMSHFLEHMMFKDNAHLKRTDYNRLIAEFGGQNNAFTSNTHTAYYELFPASYYPLAMQMEAFRMRDLHLKDEEVATEKEVIKEERRLRVDDNPLSKAYEEFSKLSQPDSPKSRPVIGSMQDIDNLTTQDLQNWYDTYYAPNNATLVVVGDVSHDEVVTAAKRYFGNKKPANIPQRKLPRQASHQGYRHAITHQSVKVPSLMMAFNVPTLTTSDKTTTYALSLFQYILDGDMSSYFERVLVREKQLFSRISVSYDSYEMGDGLFFIEGVPAHSVSLQDAENAILQVIENAKNTPITDDEMQRISTSLISALTFTQDSISTQAQMIGGLVNMGLPVDSYDKLPDEIKAISPQDIQKTARHYLTKDNLTSMYILPKTDNTPSADNK
ncbi:MULTISPECIES: M16 family metallopeptidase [unclassified Moraxella]|uniref:M16 family metallopeptidase n=1 Tax=unclassified Moraxella TaxID=2685852 RepID=UPI00359DBC69